jgi:hypothetical protein
MGVYIQKRKRGVWLPFWSPLHPKSRGVSEEEEVKKNIQMETL